MLNGQQNQFPSLDCGQEPTGTWQLDNWAYRCVTLLLNAVIVTTNWTSGRTKSGLEFTQKKCNMSTVSRSSQRVFTGRCGLVIVKDVFVDINNPKVCKCVAELFWLESFKLHGQVLDSGHHLQCYPCKDTFWPAPVKVFVQTEAWAAVFCARCKSG